LRVDRAYGLLACRCRAAAIGTRPVDLLVMALEKLGAQIEIDALCGRKAPKA
jgi:UDP-N-acetylglucosamine enolpyruvyl transferase